VPEGRVLEQDPPADRQVEAGSAVDLVFSGGPKTVPVPSLTGSTVSEAEAALEAAGLVLGEQTDQNDQTVPEGQIISQDPAAGEEAPEGSPVNVVVSAGPSVVIVDDVTCLTYSNAKDRLEGLGLEVQLGDPVLPRPECPSLVNVAQQDTPGGTAVPPGTVIVLHQGTPPSPSPSPSPSP
jgi:serine/threonine-protein kinase